MGQIKGLTERLKANDVAPQVAREETSPASSFFVHRDLQRFIQEETEWRFRLWSQGAPPCLHTALEGVLQQAPIQKHALLPSEVNGSSARCFERSASPQWAM